MGRKILVLAINPGLDLRGFFPDAALSAAYSATLTAFAGRSPYTITHISGTIPDGLTWTDNSDGTGTLAGTPTTAGSATLGFRIKDGDRSIRERTFPIRVVALPLSLSLTLPDAEAGSAYAGSASASGGISPYTYTKIAGPAWMSVSTAGVISGTPDVGDITAGATVEIMAEDSQGATVTQSDTVAVNGEAIALSGSFARTDDLNGYSGTLAITGGSGSYTSATIVGGTAPPGATLGISGATVTISGAAVAGTYTFDVQVTDSVGATSSPYETTVTVWNVIALLHCNGIDGSNVPVDETGRVWSGTAEIDTSVAKWGVSSLQCVGAGSGSVCDADAGVAPGTADFMAEKWFRLTDLSGGRILLDTRASALDATAFALYTSGTQLRFFSAGADRILGPTLSGSTWYYVNLSRVAGVTRLFVGTTPGDPATQYGGDYADSTNYSYNRMAIGYQHFSESGGSVGHFDDIRVTLGGGYSSGVVVPSGPFTP